MPEITQTDATLYYVNYDGTKGSTWGVGHTVKHPFDFLLVTEDRDEWQAWRDDRCCDCDCEHDCGCDCDCGCDVCEEDCESDGSEGE